MNSSMSEWGVGYREVCESFVLSLECVSVSVLMVECNERVFCEVL